MSSGNFPHVPSAVEQLLASIGLPLASSSDNGSSAWPSIIWSLINPTLPPILAPLPFICRLASFLVLLPVILYGMVDFAGYAVFRTLGLRRRRVRVKRDLGEGDAPIGVTTLASTRSPSTRTPGAASPGLQPAPLLSPGAYDAQTLLRHRARSISSASAEANEEWLRTGGSFARVSNVRAELAKGSPRPQFDLGVVGHMGLDTDDSGPESGAASPLTPFARLSGARPGRRGLGGNSLGFTPVDTRDRSSQSSSGQQPSQPAPVTEDGASAGAGSAAFPSIDDTNAAHANALSASLSSLSTTGTGASWVGIEPLIHTAAASDLEPESSFFAKPRPEDGAAR